MSNREVLDVELEGFLCDYGGCHRVVKKEELKLDCPGCGCKLKTVRLTFDLAAEITPDMILVCDDCKIRFDYSLPGCPACERAMRRVTAIEAEKLEGYEHNEVLKPA